MNQIFCVQEVKNKKGLNSTYILLQAFQNYLETSSVN